MTVLFAQDSPLFKNVMIDIQDGKTYPPCEPSIVINPKNTNEIMGAAILDKVYRSTDGGATWNVSRLTSSLGVFGDPCLVTNKKGHYYYFHLSNPSGLGWADESLLDRIVCQRSNNGKKWSDGAGIGLNGSKDQDKEWAVTNPKTNEVYVAWTQFDSYNSKQEGDSTVILFSKSNKKAKEFSEPVRISNVAGDCLDDDETTEGAVPAVGANGEIYVAWAVNETIFFDRSLDNGTTWLETDIEAARIVGGWSQKIPGIQRCNGMPVLKCDLSGGEHHGRIYINWTDQRSGMSDTDVWLVYSDDQGTTWSNAIKVNQDDSKRHQFFTWLDIDQTNGNLYTVYYDRRVGAENETDVYLSASLDGGITWSDYIVSSTSFIPNDQVFFGDYNNISAHSGVIRPIWTRYSENKLSVWTALINESQLFKN
ncbi:MAG: sialidase family protein [Flavobacteriales bacterium]